MRLEESLSGGSLGCQQIIMGPGKLSNGCRLFHLDESVASQLFCWTSGAAKEGGRLEQIIPDPYCRAGGIGTLLKPLPRQLRAAFGSIWVLLPSQVSKWL